MKVMKKSGAILATAAAAALLVGCHPPESKTMANDAPVKCNGGNSCKGASACKTAKSSCQGLNSCKGQGFVMLSAAECKKAGGTTE